MAEAPSNRPGDTANEDQIPAAEPVAKPVEEPVAKPAEVPVGETVPEPVGETVPDPVAEPAEEPIAETVPEPASETAAEHDTTNPQPETPETPTQNPESPLKTPDSAVGGIFGSSPSNESPEHEDLDETKPTVAADVEKHVEISSATDVNVQMRDQLLDLIKLIKAKYSRTSEEPSCSDQEIDDFLDRVFHGGWTTRRPFIPPHPNTRRSIVLQTVYRVKVRRSTSRDGQRLVKLKKGDKGIDVYIVPAPRPPKVVKFTYMDVDKEEYELDHPDLLDYRDFARAMQEYDLRQLRTLGGYNRAWAVFFARGRLVHWADGNELESRPPDEDLEEIVKIHLCYDCAKARSPYGLAKNGLRLYRQIDLPPFDLRMDRRIPRSVG